MADSATPPTNFKVKEDDDDNDTEPEMNTQNRICDFCGDGIAFLYCRADSAKLCFACDREVHSTNQLFTKHTRSLLCNSCDSSPASIFCPTESSVFCQNCDWERHSKSPASVHERRPVEGFTGCPSVADLLEFVGFGDLGKKALFASDGDWFGSGGFGSEEGLDDGYSDFLVWDTPSILSMDDLIGSNSSEHQFQAMGVPPLPKNRKACCGKYKEQILDQLREMAKTEPNFDDSHGETIPLTQFQSMEPKEDLQAHNVNAGYSRGAESATGLPFKTSALWSSQKFELADQDDESKPVGTYFEDYRLVPEKDCDIVNATSPGHGDDELQSLSGTVTETPQIIPKIFPKELTPQERDHAISRYKEKKKTRRYDKHVRYESRRIRAEKRTRIKGRFAKLKD